MKFVYSFSVFLSCIAIVSGQFFGGTQFYQSGQYQAAGFSPFPAVGYPFGRGGQSPFLGGGQAHTHVHYHADHGHGGFGSGLIPGGINSRDVGSGMCIG